jgi:hypothetical protein
MVRGEGKGERRWRVGKRREWREGWERKGRDRSVPVIFENKSPPLLIVIIITIIL